MLRLSRSLAIVTALLLWALPSSADDYPTRSVTITIPFSAGGGFDAMARILANNLKDRLGQAFIVENKTGAEGALAAVSVATAAPDGYSLLLAIDSMLTMMPHIRQNLKYDPLKSFEPVSLVNLSAMLIVANPKLKVKTLSELIAHMRANPGKLNVTSASINARVFLEQLKQKTNTQFAFIPFRGSSQMVTALLAGEIDLVLAESSSYVPLINEGKLVPISTTGLKIANLPQVPSVAEAGYAELEVNTWAGMFAPANTSAAIVGKLTTAIGAILNGDETAKSQLTALGREIKTSGPEELATRVKTESAKWGAAIKAAGISFD
jgi:tripartite-type tricarboxylate transporter receptor subunit TctC